MVVVGIASEECWLLILQVIIPRFHLQIPRFHLQITRFHLVFTSQSIVFHSIVTSPPTRVQFIGATTHKRDVLLILEYMSRGSMHDLLHATIERKKTIVLSGLKVFLSGLKVV